MLTSSCQRAVVAQVVAFVVAQVVAAAHQLVVVGQVVVAVAAVVRQQAVVVAAVVEQAVVVQRAFALLQAVPQAFAGKIQQTELRLLLQVAVTFSFYLPPNEFCF
jgi:hypothetical protein